MAKAVQLPSGTWRVQVFLGIDSEGKKIKKSITASTKWEAERLAAMYTEEERASKSKFTVGQALDEYIDFKRNVLSPSTLRGYDIIRRNRLQSLMQLDIHQVDSIAVQRAINADAETRSTKSIEEAVHLITTALKLFGVQLQLNITLPPRKPQIKELPTADQVINMIRGTDIELPCMLAMWLSLRMSEVRGLQFGDIKDGVLTVRRSKLYIGSVDVVRDVNKTYASTRRILVPQYIQSLIDAVPHDNDDDFIVPQNYQFIKKHLKRLAEANGFTLTFHDLRHLNASVMLMLGIPDKYAMERGGWSTNSTLKSVYQHTFSEERKHVDEKIDGYFNGLLGE